MEIIKDLYINYVGCGDTTRIDYLLTDRIDSIIKELQKKINNKHKKKLETLCNDYEKVNLIETEQAFTRGFAFAVQLLSEAYSHKL